MEDSARQKRVQDSNAGLLLAGRFVSGFGDRLLDYANIVWITSSGTGGQMLLGWYQIAESVTSVLLNVIGGAGADRFDRKRILIICDCCAAAVCLALALCSPTDFFAYAMIAANVMFAAIGAFSSPAYRSIVPQLVANDRVIKLNSTLELINQLLSFVSPVVSLAIVRGWGSTTALLIDAVTFLVSAMLNIALRMLHGTGSGVSGRNSEVVNNGSARTLVVVEVFRDVLSDIAEGVRFIIHRRTVFTLLILSSAVNIFLSLYNLALPYIGEAFHGNGASYATALVCEAVGGVAGSLVSGFGRVPCTYRSLVVVLGLSGVSLAATAPLHAVMSGSTLIFACIVLFNAMLTLYNIQFISLIQTDVEERFLGRVFSVVFTVAVLFMPLGTVLFSVAVDARSSDCFVIAGAGVVAVAVLAFVFGNRLEDKGGAR